MKKLSLLAIIAIALFSNNVNAQTEATETTNAHAKLIKVMSLANADTDGLDFGTIVLTAAGASTVSMAAVDATRVYGANSAAAVNANQSANTAKYNVTGTPNETYALTLPTTVSLTTATLGSGLATMTIDNLKARFSGGSADAVVSKLSTTGTDSFAVGGTLNIDATQKPGDYTGIFNVTVDYN
ncbi:protein of unknown function [Flavobacterium gillisiae]|uniref:DUF4402 domain-containing protein n=1 Tax=Flavobacterium gillisiae TaxID=150146 RepID=A0A1H4G422_9FLAO|nr:DUF4402 domain-containing protein [Flavobacterium gillisiae]SEB04329.1 protein of unknown function [Flavobacterium gillisiae]